MKKSFFTSRWGLVLSLGVLLSYSCSDDPEPTPPPVNEPPVNEEPTTPPTSNVNWNRVSVFSEDMYNSTYLDGKFTALGRNFLYYDASLETENERQFLGDYLTRLGRYKLPLSDKIFVSRTELDVLIFPMGELDPSKQITLRLSEIDPAFKAFEDIQFWQGDVLGVNKSGTAVLVPYRTIKDGLSVNNPSFLLLKTDLEDGVVVVKDTLIVDENIRDFYVEASAVSSNENFFIVNIEGRSYLIDHDGNVEELSEHRVVAVEKGNQVFFIEEDRRRDKLVVYVSGPEGKNRNLVGETDLNEDLIRADYTVVRDQLVGFEGNKIFKLTTANNQVRVDMLPNGSVAGAISSMNQIGEDKVVITIIRQGQGGAFSLSVNSLLDQ
ncbi:hypothetical protein [Cecembia lonarensis]|uniref:Uncharacterized protein n=1 Tax=Cecembia lonarensis (strain CCUG 58316 / KCTC 22772 / LW9) TaxID=1225176 RepID=K1LTI1_CECL9|nr:hypothetical protein [Cecembia lonarensis]EKB47464.1 hypothetical protein B879_03939 [Cecembia lonarensis LW9]